MTTDYPATVPAEAPRPRALVILQGREYLHPYLRKAFEPDYELEIAAPDAGVASADASVCILAGGDALPSGAAAMPVIDVPEIVATGMQGLVRRLAREVASGRFFAIRDYEYPRIRVVHAVDLAAAARIAAEAARPGRWTLDDGCAPRIDVLADALAFRIKGKRLYTLPRRWAMLAGVGRFWRGLEYTPAAGASFVGEFDFKPHDVCAYLKTHVYDENSL